MAVLKIYESQTRVKDPQVAQTGALTIPVGIATQYGQAISSVGKVVEKIQLENKAEEDANEASDLITLVNQKIAEKYNDLSKSTKTADVLTFGQSLDDRNISDKIYFKLIQREITKIYPLYKAKFPHIVTNKISQIDILKYPILNFIFFSISFTFWCVYIK